MKLHLPLSLRKNVLSCLLTTLSITIAAGAIEYLQDNAGLQGDYQSKETLTLVNGQQMTLNGNSVDSSLNLSDGTLSLDYGSATAPSSMQGNDLTLSGGTTLHLIPGTTTDGKYINLLTNVGTLYGADGSQLIFSSANNAASQYFDTSQPGSGYWKDATLQLTSDGTLQMQLHNGTVKDALTITARQTGSVNYCYYESISFEDIVYSTSSTAYGGAIYGGDDSTITLSNNGSVTFSGNTSTASGGYGAYGGAIYGKYDSTITLSDNGSVTFSGNTATSSGYKAYGGAIDGGNITLSNNGSVTFSGNAASGSSAEGGAIRSYGNLSIRNNDSVLFEKNAEISNRSYRLRSIYAGGSGDIISLSAAKDGNITFKDSIYIASGKNFELNADYTDDNNVVHKQTGDIIFTGADTEKHLNELLTAAEAGRTATAAEIENSRLTLVYAETLLYGGRLRVEDGAVYQGRGITAMKGSGATVHVQDAELRHSGYDLTFNSGTRLELVGDYSLLCSTLMMEEGSTLLLDASSAIGTCALTGNLTMNGSMQLLLGETTAAMENAVLMWVSGEVSGWTDSSLTLNVSTGVAHIEWVNNHLVLNYNASTYNQYFNGSIAYSERQFAPLFYHHYEEISFKDIAYSTSSSSAYGGAIYGDGDITLSNNGSVIFSENSASGSSAYGGAIYGYGDIMLSNNGSVTFSGNTASGGYVASGGAIYGGDDSTITLSANDGVTFSGNKASGSSAYGGAIYGYGDITLSANGSVTFSGNTSSGYNAYGGAIYGGDDSTITLSNNGIVTFDGNSVGSSSTARGGAIYGGDDSTITLSDNESVTFSGNTATTSSGHNNASGGAIYGGYNSTITLSANGSVTFDGNTASGYYNAYGGAVYIGGTSPITLSSNKSVTFSGNSVESSYYASGGAIYGGDDSTITLSTNESVTFSGNTVSATSSDGYASGGAIYGGDDSTITLSDNGSVTFSGNTSTASGGYGASGGAIRAYGNLSIRNNDSVLFEKNAEISNGSYRLRSIYAEGSGDEVSLSAAKEKSIEFRDSVYIASGYTVKFNEDYTDAAGVVHKQEGDIIFTGADTEKHLNELLTAVDAGRTATAVEIVNSRLTFVDAETRLYGGRLRVEDGAIYQGRGITAMKDSGATVRVQDAELHHSGYDLTFNSGTILELVGDSSLLCSTLMMEEGSTLLLDASSAIGTCDLTGNLTMNGSMQLRLGETTAAMENAVLMWVSGEVNGWTDSSLTLKGSTGDAHITWVNNHLVLNYKESTYNQYFNGSIAYSERQFAPLFYHYGEISFKDIAYSTSSSTASGGAIYGGDDSTITLSANGSVTFSGNTACSSSASGGAIYGGDYSTITLSDNGSVTFSGNTACGYYNVSGGAIYGGNDSTITLSGNGSVTFSGNKATTSSGYNNDSGGAIYGRGHSTITLSGNGSVTFSGNTYTSSSSTAYGGAIYGEDYSTIMLSNNGSVTFSGNTSTSSSSSASGGAIYGGTITLSNNESVSFSGNTATSSSSSAYGGAIYGGDYSTITLSDNGSVTFRANTASGEDYAYGGAIYGDDDIMLSNNDSVIFSENSASGDEAYGGAIRADGNLSIRNNDSVLFEKNAEITNGSYRLCSIYAGSSGGVVSLSAAKEKSIEFRDSVTIASGSTVKFNEDYTDAAGLVHKQEGDIIFTGADTEKHLNELLTAAQAGRTATAAEIENSRLTLVDAVTRLYGGRLRVEDGAVYQGRGITAMKDSGATVRVQDAELNHSGYNLTFNSGTTLELCGESILSGELNLQSGSTLRLLDGSTSHSGNLSVCGGVEINLSGIEFSSGSNRLMILQTDDASITWAPTYTLVRVANFAQTGYEGYVSYGALEWESGELYVDAAITNTATWNNATGNGLWDGKSENWVYEGNRLVDIQGIEHVILGETAQGNIRLEGEICVGNIQVKDGCAYILNPAEGAGLQLTGTLSLEGSSSLSVNGDLMAAAVSGEGALSVQDSLLVSGAVQAESLHVDTLIAGSLQAGSLQASSLTLTDVGADNSVDGVVTVSGDITSAGSLSAGGAMSANAIDVKGALTAGSLQAGSLQASSLTLTDADATNTIGNSVAMSGAADVAGELEINGALTAGSLQAGSLQASSLTLTDADATNTIGNSVAMSGDITSAGSLRVDGAVDVAGSVQASSLTLAQAGVGSTVGGDMNVGSLELASGAALTVRGTLTAGEVNIRGMAKPLQAGAFGASTMNFDLDRAALESLGLGYGQTGTIAQSGTALAPGFVATLNGGTTEVEAAAYIYTISTSDSSVQLTADYAFDGLQVWYRGAWVGKSSWTDFYIGGFDAVDGVESIDLNGDTVAGANLYIAYETGVTNAVVTNGTLEFDYVDLGGGQFEIGSTATVITDELYGKDETLVLHDNATLSATVVTLGTLVLNDSDVTVKKATINAISGTEGSLTIEAGGSVTVKSDVTLTGLNNLGTLDLGEHALVVNALVNVGGNVSAGEVTVQSKGRSMAVFDTLEADKVTVTNVIPTGNYTDGISVGAGSAIGELVAETLEVSEGEVTLGRTSGSTEMSLLDLDLQEDATLVLNQQTRLTVTNELTATEGATVQLHKGAGISYGEVSIANRKNDSTTAVNAYELSEGTISSLSNAHISMNSSDDSTIDWQLINSSVENTGSGTVTITNADNSLTDVYATHGNITILQQESLDLAELKVGASVTVSAYTGDTESPEYEATITVSDKVSLGAEATLNTDLIIKAGATLEMGGTVDMGSKLYLNSNTTLGGELLTTIQTAKLGSTVTLFTGIDALYFNGKEQTASITLDDRLSAGLYFSNLLDTDNRFYYMLYEAPINGDGMLSIVVDGLVVPEPTTATLSLLALAALAARRRRTQEK